MRKSRKRAGGEKGSRGCDCFFSNGKRRCKGGLRDGERGVDGEKWVGREGVGGFGLGMVVVVDGWWW